MQEIADKCGSRPQLHVHDSVGGTREGRITANMKDVCNKKSGRDWKAWNQREHEEEEEEGETPSPMSDPHGS